MEKSLGSHRGQGKGVGEKRVADARPLTGNQNICPIVNSRVQVGVGRNRGGADQWLAWERNVLRAGQVGGWSCREL